jgi:1,4-dihydroxy-2-naphthoate octaprenyltransferase
MSPWLMAFRPKTLTAAVVPVAVATALTHHDGFKIHWWVTWCALASALLIQIATNLLNDAIDFHKGADTAERIGPQRVTQSGLLSSRMVMTSGLICLLAAAALGVPLLIHGGMPILWIGLASLFLGYAYTGGPFPLAYKGLGDVFVILFFGVIAVGGVYFLQTRTWNIGAAMAGLQIGLLATVLLAVNNLRDVDGDRKVNKKTLAVRLGVQVARYEIALCAIVPFVLGLYWLSRGDLRAALWPILMLPVVVKLLRAVFTTAPSPLYNRFLGLSALVHLGFGLLFCLGLL